MDLKEAIYWLMMNGYEVKLSSSEYVAHTGFDTYINCLVSKKSKASTNDLDFSASTTEEIRFSGLEYGKEYSIKDVEKKMSKLVERLKGSKAT
jgi:hypothetical protein